MPLADEDEKAIDEALRAWRQGDACLDAGLEFLHLAAPVSPPQSGITPARRCIGGRWRSARRWTHAGS